MISTAIISGFCFSATNVTVAIGTIGLSLYLLKWRRSIRKQVQGLSLRFLGTQPQPVQTILKDIKLKLESQESLVLKTIAELNNIRDNKALSNGTVVEGPIGSAIQSLKDQLQSAREQESRQNWIVQGSAVIAGIRKNNSSIEDYAFHLIQGIVKYMDANQAALFLMEDTSSLRLLATYAYGKRRFSDGVVVIDKGNGLLGQCALEKELIYMTAVPRDYVKITSGLGEATPKCIAIFPLIYRDEVYGIIELASLNLLEPHHLEFLRKSSEDIASELAALQIQSHTHKLLEQAQAQATQLISQEEELRQSMEEMETTQEEMRRKEKALEEKLEEIEGERAKNLAILETCGDAVISFNIDGTIEFCNRAGEEVLGYSREELNDHSILEILNIHVSTRGGAPILLSKTGTQITAKSEVNTTGRNGEELSLLLTATHIKLKEKSLFTLFAQKISVDLF